MSPADRMCLCFKSLITVLNRTCHRIDPTGTPLVIGFQGEYQPLSLPSEPHCPTSCQPSRWPPSQTTTFRAWGDCGRVLGAVLRWRWAPSSFPSSADLVILPETVMRLVRMFFTLSVNAGRFQAPPPCAQKYLPKETHSTIFPWTKWVWQVWQSLHAWAMFLGYFFAAYPWFYLLCHSLFSLEWCHKFAV